MSAHPTRVVGGVTVVDVENSYDRATFLELRDVCRKVIEGGSPNVLLSSISLPCVLEKHRPPYLPLEA